MKHRIGCLRVIGLLVVLGCVGVAVAQQPKPGGTLRVGWEADISGLDPHLSFGMQARLLVGNLFNSLVTIDAELNVVPDLAESWEILEDSKVYVFHLRKGVTRATARRAVLGYGIDRPAIVKTALLGQAQPLWSFVPPGSRGHLDFGEQFPYNPDKARALLKEAGYDEQNPLRYTLMTHSAEASLPIIATVMKTQLAKIGVEVTVEVLDRPIFLRRVTRHRDWDQFLANVAAAIDPHTISQGIDSRAGNNTINHADTQVDALIDRMRGAATEPEYLQAGYDFQRYVVGNMMSTSVSSYGFLQAARTYVKGYENLHGYKLRFETTWLDR